MRRCQPDLNVDAKPHLFGQHCPHEYHTENVAKRLKLNNLVFSLDFGTVYKMV